MPVSKAGLAGTGVGGVSVAGMEVDVALGLWVGAEVGVEGVEHDESNKETIIERNRIRRRVGIFSIHRTEI
jgi:hypothetical protein